MPSGIFFDIHLFPKLKVIHFPLSCYLVKVITRTNELMENSSEQRRKQEKILEERLEQINKLEATVKSVSAEVIKVCVFMMNSFSSSLVDFVTNLRLGLKPIIIGFG